MQKKSKIERCFSRKLLSPNEKKNSFYVQFREIKRFLKEIFDSDRNFSQKMKNFIFRIFTQCKVHAKKVEN